MKVLHPINILEDLHFELFSFLNNLRNWGLTQSDLKVLSELYNIYSEMHISQDIKNYEDRMAILFSSETKKKIMGKLSMSYNTFNNSLSKLRKKGFVNEDNTIEVKRLLDLTKNTFEFTIKFMDEKEYSRFIEQKKK